MKNLFHLVLTSFLFVTITSQANAQITEKPSLDFKVEVNDLNQQLEVVWASCLENSIIKLLDVVGVAGVGVGCLVLVVVVGDAGFGVALIIVFIAIPICICVCIIVGICMCLRA